MKRITRTCFPSRVTRKGNVNYLSLPAPVVERMDLKEGDYLDVTVSLPKVEEIDVIEQES